MPLIDLILSWLSIFRWNTFPRLRSITALDHLGFVAHIAIILAHARAEKEGEIYDIGLLLKKILFSGFFTFFYSDISAEVKDRIREKNPHIYRELEDDVRKKLFAFDIPQAIQADIELSYTKTKEDTLISFAKMWASYTEIEQNATVYPDAYKHLLKNMKDRSEREEFQEFFEYVDFDTSHQSGIEQYLHMIHRLASSFRWNRSVRKYPISVLSHTFLIAFLTYTIAREKWLDDTTMTDMVLTALLHDIPEAITGDIITPTKKSVPWLEQIIEEVEREMVHEELISCISDYSFSTLYAQKMLSPWTEPHGDLVKQADRESALHEARIEAPYSEDFRQVYETLQKKLNESPKK